MTVEDIGAAARRALDAMGESASGDRKGGVARVVLDVTIDGRTEMVTVMMRDGEIVLSSTDGQSRGPYVLEALRLLAAAAFELPKGVRTSPGDLPGERVSLIGPEGRGGDPQTASSKKQALADALEDVVVAVARAGVREASDAPAVREALERLSSTLPSPVSLATSRWLALLRVGLGSKDVVGVARTLDGACRLAEDLRADSIDERARRRLVAWLGAAAEVPGAVERMSDRTMIELGREHLAGAERSSIERRYLFCVDTAELFREERARASAGGSVGPVPRLVTVGLAEAEDGATPRAIRLLQYSVVNVPPRSDVERVRESAKRSVADLAADYERSIERYPGLAEPFAIFAPARVVKEPAPALLDSEGTPLPLARADDAGRSAALLAYLGDKSPEWVAGRLVDAEGTLLMIPLSVGLRVEDRVAIRRI